MQLLFSLLCHYEGMQIALKCFVSMAIFYMWMWDSGNDSVKVAWASLWFSNERDVFFSSRWLVWPFAPPVVILHFVHSVFTFTCCIVVEATWSNLDIILIFAFICATYAYHNLKMNRLLNFHFTVKRVNLKLILSFSVVWHQCRSAVPLPWSVTHSIHA